MAWALPSVQPTPQGLYDARHEHDACGVAFVATLTGVPSHTIVEQALTALRNLEHRGASGAEPDSGDGAGLLVQVPGRLPARRRRLRAPGAGLLRRRQRLPPARRPRRGGRAHRGPGRRGGSARPRAGATCPIAPELIGSTARAVMPVFRQLFVSQLGRPHGGDGAGAARLPAAQARRALPGRLLRVAVGADLALQGDAHHRPARAVLPRPVRRAVRQRARPRPLAVLHQHLPVLAARPPLPLHRAQRRDQHRARQPELDARAGVAAGQRPDPRATSATSTRSARRTSATRRPSTRPSSCCTWAAGRCRTPC